MPKVFRLRPKKDDGKFFKPPSRIKKEKERESRWSNEYREARNIRSSGRWKKLRDQMVRQNPVCEDCCQAPSFSVHHIEPLTEKPDRGFDKRNLICLCPNCHDTAHHRDWLNDPMRVRLLELAGAREDRMENNHGCI